MVRSSASEKAPTFRAKLFRNGRSQAVRLPKQFRFDGPEVMIRKEGASVVLEPIRKRQWPTGYWRRVERRANDLDVGRVVPLGGRLLDVTVDDV